jgi:8-oxo-dGTP diphosphatase
MAGLLLRIWALPWPDAIRQRTQRLASARWVQTLLFPRFLVGVVAVIQNDQGEVLFLRHTYRGNRPWGLPSGWMERGEQPADALRRELSEEAGLQVELTTLYEVRADSHRPHLNIVFRGRYLAGEFQASTEVSEARFFPKDRLPPLLPDQRRLVFETFNQEVANETPA